MYKIFTFVGGILMTSSVIAADETTLTKSCANGAGTIVTGAISGHEYCLSNNDRMVWWDAYAWCDALGRQLFKLEDCRCSVDTNCLGRCPEMNGVSIGMYGWTATPSGTTEAYVIQSGNTALFHTVARSPSHLNYGFRALCK